MKFDIESSSVARFKKNGHTLIKECIVYLNKDISYFAILKSEWDSGISWGFIHLISEEVLTCRFNTKECVEQYFDFLNEQTDLNSIFLCQPDIKKVFEQDEFNLDIELAYKKYLQFKRGR
jgi:hypothetical protein